MTIGVICAMDPELEKLISKLENCQEQVLGNGHYYKGLLEDHEVVLARCGIGKVSAACVTAILISVFKVSVIINSGSAGALNSELKLGDTVFSTSTAYHDADLTILGYQKGQMAGHELYFKSSPELIAKAEIAAANVPSLRYRVKKGIVLSGDQFISSEEKKKELCHTFNGAMVTEMEGAAIAQVASDFNIPFIIIRSVSDGACEGKPLTFEEFLPLASENSAKLVLALIRLI